MRQCGFLATGKWEFLGPISSHFPLILWSYKVQPGAGRFWYMLILRRTAPAWLSRSFLIHQQMILHWILARLILTGSASHFSLNCSHSTDCYHMAHFESFSSSTFQDRDLDKIPHLVCPSLILQFGWQNSINPQDSDMIFVYHVCQAWGRWNTIFGCHIVPVHCFLITIVFMVTLHLSTISFPSGV